MATLDCKLDLPDEAVIRHYGFNFDQIMKDARTAEIVSHAARKAYPVYSSIATCETMTNTAF